ncbi:MAG: TMEM165/GDT1 family protein [Mycobacteriaceae bacterium]|nr:TMEM165/GDT1 family protein [Mycobacteriaceae bacterium]
MFAALLLSFAAVFLAELGDKSQLVTMAFALRYRRRIVLAGIATGAALVFGLAVTVGHVLGAALPTTAVAVLSGAAFLAMGLWSLRLHEPDTDGTPRESAAARRSGFLAVTSTLMLCELGDKTMLAAMSLASTHSALGVWAGATLAMIAADALALAVGRMIGSRVSEQRIRLLSGYGFLAAGGWTIAATQPAVPAAAALAAAVAVPALAALSRWGVLRLQQV